MKRTVRMLSFKMRNLRGLENYIFDQQLRGFFQSSGIKSTRPEVFHKKVALNNFENSQENTCVGVFFNKFASLTSLKADSSTRVFSANFGTF